MQISQRRYFTATRFDFESDRLIYEFRVLGGSKQFSVDYADLATDVKVIEERHAAYLYVGLVLFGVGALVGAFIYSTESRVSGFNWAVFGVIFLVAYILQRRRLSIVYAPRDSVIVLGGEQHDQILSEIEKRRKGRFLRILERPDLANDEVRRNGLIATLREQRVLSEDEAASLMLGQSVAIPADSPRANVH